MKKVTPIKQEDVSRIKSATAKKTGGTVPKKSFAARAESALTKATKTKSNKKSK